VAFVTVPAIRWVRCYWNPPGGHAVAYVTVPAIRWITNLLAPSEGGSRGGVCHGAGDSLGSIFVYDLGYFANSTGFFLEVTRWRMSRCRRCAG
jgi:hypothetical protein